MEKIRLGKTGLMVSASSFGALPIQRISVKDAGYLLRKAYDSGINYFDTANAYSDSEEKIGAALSDVREHIIISTKSGGKDYDTVLSHIQLSLKRLKTDYIDLIQLHNPSELPDVNDPHSTYAACVEAKRRGYVRFIGITNHGRERARAAVLSGAYDTLQFPLTCIAPQEDIDLAHDALSKSEELIGSGKYDVAVLDEAMNAVRLGLITSEELIASLKRRPKHVEIVLTGRGMTPELEEYADLITEMRLVKHPMDKGIDARMGIEY